MWNELYELACPKLEAYISHYLISSWFYKCAFWGGLRWLVLQIWVDWSQLGLLMNLCSVAGLVVDYLVSDDQGKDSSGLFPVVSQPGPYSDKTSIPFPFIFNLSMSLNSFCNLFNLCHVRTLPRVTSLNLVAWIFLRQGVKRPNISSDLFLITFRVIIFMYFMAISPKCFQEGAEVQTKLIDWLIRWPND